MTPLPAILALFFLGSPSPAPSADPPARRRLDLSLSESLSRALRFQPDLAAAERVARAAAARIEESDGIFDPVSTTRVDKSDETIPGQPGLFSQPDRQEEDLSASTQVRQTLATGGTYSLLFTSRRFDSRFSGGGGFDFSRMGIELAVTQPLLRGGWTTIAQEQVRHAEFARDLAMADHAKQRQTLLYDVAVAYWDLVFAREDRDVKRLSVSLAEKLLEINRRKVEVGASAPVEVYQAETDIAIRREALATAEKTIASAEDRLRGLVFPFETGEEWNYEIVPSTAPPSPGEPASPEWERVLEMALASRPDLERARKEVADAELTLVKAANDKMPRLDVEGRIGSNDKTWEDTYGWDAPRNAVGVVLEFPFGNSAARGRTRAAEESLAAARIRLRGLENLAAQESRGAVRELRYLVDKRAATKKSRELAERQLEAGEVKFEAGAATNFEVLELQEDLAAALSAEKAAILDHAKAIANLGKVQGTLAP